MSVSAEISSANKVYYGPSPTLYPSVGSVAINDSITIYWEEDDWFYIQYDISTTRV